MISAGQIKEILAQYKKHGWSLRRVLLSARAGESLADSFASLFGETEIVSSATDAVGFSRATGKNGEAWELRRLSNAPFALFEIFDAEDDEVVREEIRFEMQERLINDAGKECEKNNL